MLVLLALGARVAETAPSSQVAPITSGSPSSDTAVVALAHGDALVCSGVVIAPHAVLTAAHCLQGALLPSVAVGDTLAAATRHTVVGAFVHPDFDAQTLDRDIAIAIVDPPLAEKPIRLASVLGATPGSTIRVVGYGWTVADDTAPAVRLTGTSTIDAVDATRVVSHAAPSQSCEGDSGGPALFDGGDAEQVIGVASSGDAACLEHARHTRVDVHRDFITAAVARSAAGGAGAGDRCWYAANCATGACLPARDEPRWSFCAPPCDGASCPGGLECVTIAGDARCRHPLPSPGARGAACASDTECAEGSCLSAAGESRATCTVRCFSDLPGFGCPADTTCRPASGGGEACFAPVDDGGCTTSRGHGLALVLVVLVQLLRGRGRP